MALRNIAVLPAGKTAIMFAINAAVKGDPDTEEEFYSSRLHHTAPYSMLTHVSRVRRRRLAAGGKQSASYSPHRLDTSVSRRRKRAASMPPSLPPRPPLHRLDSARATKKCRGEWSRWGRLRVRR